MVSNKRENNFRFANGLYGNKLRQWDSPDAAEADGFDGMLMVRSVRPGDPYCKSYLTVEEARAHIADACRATGVPASTYYVGEMISREVDAKRPFQGEVFLSPAGITLNYTTEPGPMRIAMAAGMKHAEGLEARMLLVANLDATAYDRIMAMLEEYDEVVDGHGSTASHVVEFSMFQDAVGDDPWTRCVVWEVRGPY
jgi:hypothetical protein